jgi:hypothetical protein
MELVEYQAQFDAILEGRNTEAPYDSEQYRNYVKMNKVRMKRWDKKGKILPELEQAVSNINEKMTWLLITEPWCGDAAHSNPFITKLASLNTNITLDIQNRDASDSEIDNYLTNGGKSIPMLVVRDADGNDFFNWGPRPSDAQEMYLELRKNNSPDIMNNMQMWYNKNKGEDLQRELYELFTEKYTNKGQKPSVIEIMT